MAQRHVQAFTGGALVPEVAEGRHAELLADVQQFLLRGEQVGIQCWCCRPRVPCSVPLGITQMGGLG